MISTLNQYKIISQKFHPFLKLWLKLQRLFKIHHECDEQQDAPNKEIYCWECSNYDSNCMYKDSFKITTYQGTIKPKFVWVMSQNKLTLACRIRLWRINIVISRVIEWFNVWIWHLKFFWHIWIIIFQCYIHQSTIFCGYRNEVFLVKMR